MKDSEKEMKYCPKHDQKYYTFLNRCPICIGEEMKFLPARPLELPRLSIKVGKVELVKPSKFKRKASCNSFF